MIYIEKLKVIELFAGIGAWSKALENLNIPHEVLAAVEHDEKTINGYNLIHHSDFKKTDITKLDEKTLPDCDIICYSPPCQAFSQAGRQEGFDDERGVLFFDALRIIKEKKPKYALMENVKGLTQKKFSNEFQVMLSELEESGYRNYWQILNSSDHLIPQNRERVFIISIRNDIEQNFNFPKAQELKTRMKDLLEDEVDQRFFLHKDKYQTILENLKNKLSKESKNVLKVGNVNPSGKGMNGNVFSEEGLCPTLTTNKGEGIKIIQLGLLDIKGNEQIRRVYHPNGLSPTLNTMQGGNRQPKILVDWMVRRLTPKECLRLMGFDSKDCDILKANKVSNSQIYKMAGNSIVVNVCEELFKQLLPEYIN